MPRRSIQARCPLEETGAEEGQRRQGLQRLVQAGFCVILGLTPGRAGPGIRLRRYRKGLAQVIEERIHLPT